MTIALNSRSEADTRAIGRNLASFLGPGDVVVVEEPSYIGALQVFRSAQARLIGVPVDGEGMQTDILASVLNHQRNIKFS